MSILDIVGRAYDIGLQPWPVCHDGSKAPRGDGWGKDDLVGRLTREETLEAFRPGDTGWGLITGRPSGNLELFEVEGRFVESDGWNDFVSACADAGVDDILDRIRAGHLVASPGGGWHLPFYVDGEPLGSKKLASRPATPEELELKPDEKTKTLIETRGERAFMVAAGSNGQIHPSGGKWSLAGGKLTTIATLTAEERDLLYAVAATFDEMPERKPRVEVPAGDGLGPESFRDGVDELQTFVVERIGVGALLVEDGWRHLYTKRDGEQIWQRPGKDRGPSASVFPDGGFNCYTTTRSAVWDEVLLSGAFDHATPLGVLAAVRFGGDMATAMSSVRRSLMSNPAPSSPEEVAGLNLPAEFWEHNDLLRDVRDAAWAQMCSPDAVLGALLVRYAAVVHPAIVLPGLGSLDLFTVCVGHSGAGKSQAAKTARMLFPGNDKRGVLLDLPVGSGEGLVEKFFRFEDEDGNPCSPQKKGAQKVQWLHGLHFTADEGMALAAQAGRMGSTLIPTLCAAWMGETLGQTNASVATSRSIGPNKARLTAQINIQTVNGHKLFSEAYSATGLAQRMLCVHAQDPRIAEPSWSPPAMPPPLGLPLPPISGGLRTLEVAAPILEEISASRRAAHSPTWAGDPLDTHRLMVQLKMAALLSLMVGKAGVEMDEWLYAQQIYETHRRLRTLLQQSAVAELNQQGAMRIKTEVDKAVAVRNAVHTNDVHQTINYFRKRIEAGLSIASGDIAAGRREHRDEALEVLALEPGSRLERTSEGWRVGVA